jgi:phosphatidylserine decarboxylase
MLDGMATTATTPTVSPSLTPAPITSAQPGGGFCYSLEMAWGRFRRGFLRRYRPGYVRRMQALRQGECPNCPHDIIDSRDLKFARPVCSYWFRPEDDAFAWRGRLRLARAGLAELLFFSFVFATLTALFCLLAVFVNPWLYAPVPVIGLLWLFVISFFRDPERVIPTDATAVVSPADGTVTHIEEVNDADFPGGRALRVSIFLSVFNVHVNRTPRSAKVTRLRYFPGEFGDARGGHCTVRNEQFWIDLQDGATGVPIRVKQIAGAIARRIVCWLKLGEEVKAGDRLGMIKFGSRTDLLLPVTAVEKVLVKVGDAVHGGSTILLSVAACGLATGEAQK